MEFEEKRLRAVVAIAETGSIGRAAEVIHVSQPALSRMLSELEARLGAKLFERHAKGMLPTQAGAILIEHAQQLTFDIEQARHALEELSGLRAGTVRIGAVAAATRTLVPKALTDLRRLSPGLRVELIEAPDNELIDALLARRIDLMVASDDISHDDIAQLDYCDHEDSFQVCCRAINPPIGGDATLGDILQMDWIMLKRGRTPRSNFEALIKASGHAAPNVVIETNTIGTQISIILNSDLLGWLPRAVISEQLAAGTLTVIDIPELCLSRRVRAYRRKKGLFSKHTQLLYSCLIPLAQPTGQLNHA